MKRILLLILMLLVPVGAHAEYWDDDVVSYAVCCEDRPGCQVLQTVMLGSFAYLDPTDSLNVRVFSAALPWLTVVTEDDFLHFSEYFDVDIDTLMEVYYIALGNCLQSDLIVNPLVDDMDEQNARIVLGLFLDPVAEGAEEQMQAIRENCTEENVQMLAFHAKVPADFVWHLLLRAEAE